MFNMIGNGISYLLHPFSHSKEPSKLPNETRTPSSSYKVLENNSMINAAIEAIKEGNSNNLNELLAQGLDPNSRDERDFSLIHIAVLKTRNETEAQQLKIVETLLNYGADVNAFYSKGNYGPLTTAVRRKLPNIVELLLKHGADTTIAIKDYNKTAFDYAKEFKDDRGLKVLECFNKYNIEKS